MARYLHLLKADSQPLAGPVIAETQREPDAAVTVVVLDASPAPPLPDGVSVMRLGEDGLDHAGLLGLIFASDRVVCW